MHPNHTTQEIPYGYCHCACGQKTKIATKTRSARHEVKGQPRRYVKGHGSRRPAVQRFWEKVDKAGPGECWTWTASTYLNGYGQIGVEHQRHTSAHRFSYELHYGPIPEGIDVCHHCDNPRCINPAHLFLGSAQDNVADMMAKGRNNQAKGERQRSAKLTEAQVLRIREMHATGQYSYPALGRLFGVRGPTIRSAVLRKNWKHI